MKPLTNCLSILIIGAVFIPAWGQTEIPLELAPGRPGSRNVVISSSELVLLNDLHRISDSPPILGGEKLGTSNPLFLLDLPAVKAELQLTGDQIAQIEQIELEAEKAFIKMWNEVPEANPESKGPISESDQVALQKIAGDRDKKVAKVLSMKQRNRMKQIYMQLQLRVMGEADALVSEEFAKPLRLTPEERQRILEKANQVDASLRKKIAKLIKDARQKIRDELSQQQEAELWKLIGEEFDLDKLDPEIKNRKK